MRRSFLLPTKNIILKTMLLFTQVALLIIKVEEYKRWGDWNGWNERSVMVDNE